MSHLLDWIVRTGRARQAAEEEADALAGAIRSFLKGKRTKEFDTLRIALQNYDHHYRNRPAPEDPPASAFPPDRWSTWE
jgi:hypothetical protein